MMKAMKFSSSGGEMEWLSAKPGEMTGSFGSFALMQHDLLIPSD